MHTAQFHLYKASKQAKLNDGDIRTGVTLGEPVINWEGVRGNLQHKFSIYIKCSIYVKMFYILLWLVVTWIYSDLNILL